MHESPILECIACGWREGDTPLTLSHPPADHPDTVRLREVLAILQAINLNESPPCPQCGGDLRSDTEEEDGFTCYFCDCPRCGWSNEGDDSPLTFASAPWTKRVAAAIRQAREVSHG